MLKLSTLISLLIFTNIALACDCRLGEVNDKLANAKYVFIGKVSSITIKGTKSPFNEDHILVDFSVIQSWKGNNKKVTLDTVANRASCNGYWFNESQTYLVYAYDVKGKLDTYYCGGVIPKNEKSHFDSELSSLNELVENTHNKSIKRD
ncbi:hypothetical protein [Pseudoalteromonas sp. 1_2015MBL_MicDiv]|uniref:hypothetical protein n=1 Tax=Pseudoalteromonas sp. 1_2015MBL_MicDiv TaxID=1720343 RepID=UPI000BBE3C3A|nr:hypothetical protein [Pseudoalteromonas sp. 1_2015MBL_MicDiv]ATG78412.1 hypothetical protein AOR04_13205 [Pseudoalteromonas sp. 1_2015MBL_MicDiv]ATG79865.1 hypothetical protein AOR04_20215 [Pseudoalteromonas sp. 1_2015MBL_MicDiv]